MRGRTAFLLFLAVITTASAMAQSAGRLSQLLNAAPAGRSIDAGESEFEIQAATNDTNATIKASRNISHTTTFTTLQLTASAPLNESGGSTDIAAWSGFPDAFTLTGKYTGYWTRGRKGTAADLQTGPGRAVFDALCGRMRQRAVKRGVAPDDAAKLECDSGNMDEHAPDLLVAFDSLFWSENTTHMMWGGTATIGHRAFEYLSSGDLEKKTTGRTPKGASMYWAVIPPKSLMLITAGIEYRDKYKDADEETVCPPATGTDPQKCKTGPFGEPVKTNQKILFAEMRRHIGDRAMSLKLTYDFESDKFSGDLPVYLVGSESGALAGGIRAGWEDGKEWQFGVFVSSSFSLFP